MGTTLSRSGRRGRSEITKMGFPGVSMRPPRGAVKARRCYHAALRTTVTLDPDGAAELKAVARQRGISFKEALNQAVRAGLGARRRVVLCPPYTQAMGLRSGIDLDRTLPLVAALEEEESARKLEVRT